MNTNPFEMLKSLDDKGKVAFIDLIPVLTGLITAFKDKTDFTITAKDFENVEAIGENLLGKLGIAGLHHLDADTIHCALHKIIDENDDILDIDELPE